MSPVRRGTGGGPISLEDWNARRANGEASESLHVGLQSRKRALLSSSDIFLSESPVFISFPKSKTGRSGVDCSCGGGSEPKTEAEETEEAGIRDGADARGLPLFVLGGTLGLGAVSMERRFLLFSSLLPLGRRVPASLVFLFSPKGFGFGGPGFEAAKAKRES
jgi:hypothetical protein